MFTLILWPVKRSTDPTGKKEGDITWNEHPLEMRVPSPSEQVWCHMHSWSQGVSVKEQVGVKGLGSWSPSSPFWECCRKQLLRWPLALETVAGLLELEAIGQVRNLSSSLVLVWFVHKTQQKAENFLRQGESRKQIGLGAGTDSGLRGRLLPFGHLSCVVQYSTRQR